VYRQFQEKPNEYLSHLTITLLNGTGKHAVIGAATVFLCAIRSLTAITTVRLNVSVSFCAFWRKLCLICLALNARFVKKEKKKRDKHRRVMNKTTIILYRRRCLQTVC